MYAPLGNQVSGYLKTEYVCLSGNYFGTGEGYKLEIWQ